MIEFYLEPQDVGKFLIGEPVVAHSDPKGCFKITWSTDDLKLSGWSGGSKYSSSELTVQRS